MKHDNQGRIINTKGMPPIINNKGLHTFAGHSACNACGKEMLMCWDTICSVCEGTFCYECSVEGLRKWYCKKCFLSLDIFKIKDIILAWMKK